jgi:hypothetical protein
MTMTIQQKLVYLVTLSTIISSGGCTHTDLTKKADVQCSGILGQQFRTTQELTLIQDKHSKTMRLVTKDCPSKPQYRQLGVSGGHTTPSEPSGTITQLAGWMGLPMYSTWKCTLAAIEDGPFAGKKIAVDGEGLSFNRETVTLKSTLLDTIELPQPKDGITK